MSFLLCSMVLVAVFLFWRMGVFQSMELLLYDRAIAHRSASLAHGRQIVVLGINEADIRKYGWALDDQKLVALLGELLADGPSVIGLNLYRDLPEPRTGQYTQGLSNLLVSHTNIVCVYNGRQQDPVPPPPAVADQAERIGFNDCPVDKDGVVRRTLLLAGEGTDRQTSFDSQVAFHYLARHGISPAWFPGDPACLKLGKVRLTALRNENGGTYTTDDAEVGFQMLLDYRGVREVSPYSLDDVFSGRLPKGLLRGRIVLVGMTAASVNDTVNTPLKEGQLGVVLHAQVVEQLLRIALDGDQPTHFCSGWFQGVWTVVWGLFGGWLGLVVRSAWRFVLVLCSGVAVVGAIGWLALQQGWWVASVPATMAFSISAALVTSHCSFHEHLMRKVLMNIYSRHVSKDVAEAIWAQRESFLEGQRPRAQKATLTILFVDLKGFSTIAERMDSTELYEWLNRFLGQMAQLVLEYQGVLRQFTGDGLMAIFGVPTPHETREEQSRDAIQAVHCALAMGRRLVELNCEWEAAGKPTVSMRAGLCTGTVAVGSIGSDERFEYSVIGDVVNTASRLESYDKSLADPDSLSSCCRILIGDSTKELLNGAFVTREVGSLEVKGKTTKVAVFQVLREKPSNCNSNMNRSFINPSALFIAIYVTSFVGAFPAAEVPKPAKTNLPVVSNIKGSASAVASSNQPPVRFKPPKARTIGLKRQVNPGSRGGGHEGSVLAVLAPDGLGLTTSSQPSFWWYLSAPATNRIEFTLRHGLETPIKAKLPETGARGLHRVALAQFSQGGPVNLAAEEEYEWTVRLCDGDDPAAHPVSIGWVKWVAPSPSFRNQLANTPPASRIGLYAGEGYWYDAVEELATKVANQPSDSEAVNQLQSLLDQTGLKAVRLPGSPSKPGAPQN